MAETIRAGVIGGGWPGVQHAKAYSTAGGFKLLAVADLIPERRKKILTDAGATREYADGAALLADAEIDCVSICLPTHLHAPMVLGALKAGKHVLCETPPALSVAEARKIEAAATKAKKVVLFGLQRRFGGAEQAAGQAVAKGYAGEVYHARATWMRTRGIPIGTGWFTDQAKSGGGAMIDLGLHMLDLAWHLLGQPEPRTVFAATHQKFKELLPADRTFDVEDAGLAIIRFEKGQTLELGASWAINQPPQQQGGLVRVFGQSGSIDVYTPQGAMLYRQFTAKGEAKATALKPPRVVSHVALMRHFKECIHGKATALIGPAEAIKLMQMIEAIYKSAATGKSVEIR